MNPLNHIYTCIEVLSVALTAHPQVPTFVCGTDTGATLRRLYAWLLDISRVRLPGIRLLKYPACPFVDHPRHSFVLFVHTFARLYHARHSTCCSSPRQYTVRRDAAANVISMQNNCQPPPQPPHPAERCYTVSRPWNSSRPSPHYQCPGQIPVCLRKA